MLECCPRLYKCNFKALVSVTMAPRSQIAIDAREISRLNGEELLKPPPSVRAVILGWSTDAIEAAISLAMVAPWRTPLERSMTILQAGNVNSEFNPSDTRHTGFIDVIQATTSKLGFATNYRGLAFMIGSRAVLRPVNHFVARHSVAIIESVLPKYDVKTEFWSWFGCSVVGGALADAVGLPLRLATWMPLTHLQADMRETTSGLRPTGLGHLAAIIANSSGLAFTVPRLLCLSFFNLFVYYGTYYFCRDFVVDMLRMKLMELSPNKQIVRILSGGVAKIVGVLLASALTYPLVSATSFVHVYVCWDLYKCVLCKCTCVMRARLCIVKMCGYPPFS